MRGEESKNEGQEGLQVWLWAWRASGEVRSESRSHVYLFCFGKVY